MIIFLFHSWLDIFLNATLLLGRDFNCILDANLDPPGILNRTNTTLKVLKGGFNLIDTWTLKYPTINHFCGTIKQTQDSQG